MPNTYTPRIKAVTAKNIAKGILSDKTGRKISDTKFKELMKKDQNLRKFSYTGKNSTLDKFKAKKFFSSVIDSTKTNERFKVNKLAAKKLGLRINSKGEASQIGLNKIYQQAAKEEIAATNTGPSKQELRREAKREKAIQKIHQQERASDRRNEYDKEAKDKKSGSESSKKSSGAPIRQGGSSGIISSTHNGQSQNNYQIADNTDDKKISPGAELPKLFMSPLNNLSPTQSNIDIITKKIEISLRQKIQNLKSFNIIGMEIINKSLMNLGMDNIPIPSNPDVLKKISLESGAQLFIYGTVQKNGSILTINIEIINAETEQKITLANIEQSSLDLFDLEKKISWQIDNSLTAGNTNQNNNVPSADKAIDLPI